MLFAERLFVESLADALDYCELFSSYTGLLNMKRPTHFALTLTFGAPCMAKKYFQPDLFRWRVHIPLFSTIIKIKHGVVEAKSGLSGILSHMTSAIVCFILIIGLYQNGVSYGWPRPTAFLFFRLNFTFLLLVFSHLHKALMTMHLPHKYRFNWLLIGDLMSYI